MLIILFDKTKTFECLIRKDDQPQLQLENQASSNLQAGRYVTFTQRDRGFIPLVRIKATRFASASKVFLIAI